MAHALQRDMKCKRAHERMEFREEFRGAGRTHEQQIVPSRERAREQLRAWREGQAKASWEMEAVT